MEIMKRDGQRQAFDANKIVTAIMKANHSVGVTDAMPIKEAEEIAAMIEVEAMRSPTPLTVEAIQDRVVKQIMVRGHYTLADHYIRYRYEHQLLRKGNSTDAKILGIVDGINTEAKEENSNKNPEILSVQRDYIAGEVSRDITKRLLLPEDVVEANREGVIHFHDADYFVGHAHNCDLVNLGDMLQNGTVISGTRIDKPHRFATACNIATQIVAQVASSQFGFTNSLPN